MIDERQTVWTEKDLVDGIEVLYWNVVDEMGFNPSAPIDPGYLPPTMRELIADLSGRPDVTNYTTEHLQQLQAVLAEHTQETPWASEET